LRVHLHHGGERLTGAELVEVARSSDVVITSYDIATRDIETLSSIRWDRLLLDEAQDVKNPATKRARALRRIAARSNRRGGRVRASSGTAGGEAGSDGASPPCGRSKPTLRG
jgi:hypothetical protein